MPAYMIATRVSPVRDAEALAEYSRLNRENAAEFQALYHLVPLVVYGAMDTKEGPAPDGIIILKFPDMEKAQAWYHSPGYQKALPHRQKGADYNVVFVEGLG
jgi:uncharacterized protein (DUF1330 family)